MHPVRLVAAATIVCIGYALVSRSDAASFTITDLGAGSADAINQRGEVVGSAWIGHSLHATLRRGSNFIDLGPSDVQYSHAVAINDAGLVVGYLRGSPDWQPVIWSPGASFVLPVYGYATSVNGFGKVAGWYLTGPADRLEQHAFVYENGALSDLGSGYARGINDIGQVVGNDPSTNRAVMWDGGSVRDLGDLGGGSALASAINDRGQVVGFSWTASGDDHAFLWDAGSMTDLGTLAAGESRANAINNQGNIVGQLYDGETHAFLYSAGVIRRLDDLIPAGSGWLLADAYDINDLGQIVGSGTFGGETHGFLLTPVPEPAMLGLFGLAILATAKRQGRGQRS
jgi:probable HAF family extracellular repeat protein